VKDFRSATPGAFVFNIVQHKRVLFFNFLTYIQMNLEGSLKIDFKERFS